MPITTATSHEESVLRAAREATASVREKLAGARPDLALVFVSRHHGSDLEESVDSLAGELNARHLLGCTAEGVIEGKLEHEGEPSFTVWAAVLPAARLSASHFNLEETPEGVAILGAPEIPSEQAAMILLADPYTFPADVFLKEVGERYPQLQLLGGMASGASSPGESRLFLNGRTHGDGAVGVVVSGGIRVRPLVSQGCRPFGKHLVITKADKNCIFQLGGRPAMEKLAAEIRELNPAEQAMLQRGLHLGLAIDARKEQHRRGDFLVRNVVGFLRDQGAILVADLVRPGMTVQFHLRDAETASEDLAVLLGEARASGAQPLGALLFSCNGRGTRLFEEPNHDAQSVLRALGDIPLAGFFAAGEIGPVGGQNFLHGFTASLAIFEKAG